MDRRQLTGGNEEGENFLFPGPPGSAFSWAPTCWGWGALRPPAPTQSFPAQLVKNPGDGRKVPAAPNPDYAGVISQSHWSSRWHKETETEIEDSCYYLKPFRLKSGFIFPEKGLL